MDYRFLFQRIRYIILNPPVAWEIIKRENRPVKDPRNNFFLPLIVLVSISAFAGSMFFTNSTLEPVYSLFAAVKYFILNLAVVYASTVILGEITKALDLGKDFRVSFKLIVYSLAPMFICQVVSLLFESLIFVNILSLYGLYIFWYGAQTMLNPPEHKKMPMLVATVVVVSGFYIAGSVVLSSILDRVYFAFFS
ncbi:MAG: YIP1 family protein [Bacteroidales bacterium]